jgi:FkbM family methyltransferase
MSLFKKVIKNILLSRGYSVYKKSYNVTDDNSMSMGLKRIKNLGLEPALIIDIGAAQGTWTRKAMDYWPNANFELVEPLTEQTGSLNELKSLFPKLNYHLAVAGETSGETYLTVSEDLDGSGIYGFEDGNRRKVPIVTIDDIAAAYKGEVLIKFDTHGYELPIIKGAVETLKRTSVLLIEVYGFYISPTCLLFHELVNYLERFGFRLIDIVDIMRRPGDQAFWQCDAFFIRKDHPVFTNNSYA